MIEPDLEQFLGQLDRALHGLRRRERQRALREAHDHVLCAADEREHAGQGRDESLRSAIDAFGAVERVAAGYARPPRSRAELVSAGTSAIVAIVCALAFAPTGSRLGQLLIPTSHAAADSGCTGRWNAAPAATGFRLAWISTPGTACEVVLHDARSARVYRQDAQTGRWRAIVRAGGRSTWAVERVPAALRTQPYAVGTDGRIERRIGERRVHTVAT